MNTVEDVVVLFVPAVTITWDGDRWTIVVACGMETVRKTVPLGLWLMLAAVAVVTVVLPFNRGLPIGCTSVTLMGVTLPGVPEVRFCMALWAPLLLLLLLLSKLVPACITGAAVVVVVVVLGMLLLTACECL